MKPTIKYLLLLLLIALGAYHHFTRPRLAYVRSEVLVNEYAGMKEAQRAYKEKEQQWQANLDTLQADYQRKQTAGNTPPAVLQQMEQNARQYAQAITQMAEEEDTRMTQAVLEQINSFVQQYGKDHGYDLILGTTASGNILYGRETMDITGELLEDLNRHYNPAAYGDKK